MPRPAGPRLAFSAMRRTSWTSAPTTGRSMSEGSGPGLANVAMRSGPVDPGLFDARDAAQQPLQDDLRAGRLEQQRRRLGEDGRAGVARARRRPRSSAATITPVVGRCATSRLTLACGTLGSPASWVTVKRRWNSSSLPSSLSPEKRQQGRARRGHGGRTRERSLRGCAHPERGSHLGSCPRRGRADGRHPVSLVHRALRWWGGTATVRPVCSLLVPGASS